MMGLFRKVPPDVTELLGERERALAWSPLTPEGWLVATDDRLHITQPPLNVRWVEVLGASWDDPLLDVRLLTDDGVSAVQVEPTDARSVPQVVRERIEQSLMVEKHVPLVGSRGIRFLARRDPVTAEVFWQRLADPGLDLGNPQVAAAADRAEAELQEIYGL